MDLSAILEFASARGHAVSERDGAVAVTVTATPYVAEILLPHDILEWFVTVRDVDGREVFSDGCEHYSLNDVRDLASEMTRSVIAVLDAIRPGRIRVVPSKTRLGRSRLEVFLGDSWTDIWAVEAPTSR